MRNITNFKIHLTALMLLLLTTLAVAQERTINGKVVDSETGDPLPGATVLEKGTSNGIVTDIDGNYKIAIGENSVLVFSFVGFEMIEEAPGSRAVVNVEMSPDVSALDEIVVVGYGTQRKEDLTGSVSLVDAEEMSKQASNDVTQMMQGRVAGVAITSDGQPGAAPSVRIRGVSTFGSGGASAEPLYVVDGFPLSGGIRDINPNDIESIQVLKDATAGAIYGNRASNGVVIITTKGGRKNQEFSIGFNAYYGLQTVPQRLPVLDREGYQMINSELLANAGLPPVPGNDPTSADFIDNIDTDWQNEGYQNGSIANYNINFTGGSDLTSYFVSLDYLDNKGTLVGSGPDYKRYSFRVNTETQIGRVKFGENVYVVRSDENPLLNTWDISLAGGRPSLVNDLLQAAPTIPLYDENREGGYGGADGVIHQSITLNVPGINSLVKSNTLVNRLLANAYAELEIVEGLSFKTNLQYDNTDITDERFVPAYNLGYFFPNPNASYMARDRSSSSFLVENTLNFTKEFGKHNLSALVGQTFQEFNARAITATGVGLSKPYIMNLENAANVSVADDSQLSALSSYIGRLNYSFDDRYLLTFNIRQDASSRFRAENRQAYFPSVGVAWKVHNDITLPEFLSDLKLRGGIGKLGNQNIYNYAYQPVINRAVPYEFASGRVFGAANTYVVDPAIQWETRITRNVAIDAVLLNGRFEFTAEYYSNLSEDVLLGLPIPRSVGSLGDGITTNAASIQNSGIELSANYRQSIGDFSFEVAPNFYTVKNEVKDLGEILDNISGAGSRTVVGEAIGRHYGWKYDGIFQDQTEIDNHAFQNDLTAPGDVRFKDLNEDGVITDDDRTFLGEGMPTFYYGLNLVANYKSFDFTIFASGSGGNLINSNLYRGLMPTSGYTNWHEDILNRWTAERPSTDYPRVVHNDPNINGRDSDRPGWLQKGDYIRLNTISIGYSLPKAALATLKMKSARIYATMQNVHTFTKYKGYNPDFQAGILNPGFDYGTFPRPRTTMVGVQIKF